MADTEYTRELLRELLACASPHDPHKGRGNAGRWVTINAPRELVERCRAALPSASLGEQREPEDDLDPRTALAYAKRMKDYCEAFSDRDWAAVSLFGSVDEKNLAGALDNLTECAAMLMNMAGRVAASPASKGAGESELTRAIDDVCDWLDHCDYAEADVRPSIQRLNEIRLRALIAARRAASGQLGTSPDQQENGNG